MKSLPAVLAITGTLFLGSTVVLGITQTPLGSPLFFACAAAAGIAYLTMLGRIWSEPRAPRQLLAAAFLLAVAFRAPLVGPRVGADSDMVRYLWDGRVQTLGYSPYAMVPADPAMASAHTDETRHMPSLRARTPYPPGAQLFFRLVVSIHDSTRAMKLALVACDLLTMLVLWRWLAFTGRSEWLALAYAWNPLVVFEVAHSGHIDALGALWITASAYWLARRRTALASIAFVLAVATKLLPIVLVPLYWRRVRLRDALVGTVLLALLYLTFTSAGTLPFGAVPNVVAHIRFNGPLFRTIAGLAGSPQAAALVAVALGTLVAAWARWRLDAADPAAWGWPMAIALACAPVIYPWYLLYLTPFLFAVATLPLTAWTLTVLGTYVVWQIARNGGRWVVPSAVMSIEYAVPSTLAMLMLLRNGTSRQLPVGHNNAVTDRTLQNPIEPSRTQ
jgi:alpha-1,6-mannosyltransferase